MVIFINQQLTVMLIAHDNSGVVMDLTGRTVHYLTRDPSGNVATDTTPTIANDKNGQVVHVHAVNELDEAGDWMDKLFIDGVEVPSTRYIFTVTDTWDK